MLLFFMDWAALQALDGQTVSGAMPRSAANTAAYAAARADLAARGMTISEHISQNVLGPHQYMLTRNTYPYELAPGIVHLVLWMRKKLSIAEARQLLADGGIRGAVVFENAPGTQSVPGVSHYQVFVRCPT